MPLAANERPRLSRHRRPRREDGAAQRECIDARDLYARPSDGWDMSLNDSVPKTVAFIVGTRTTAGATRQVPIGTGFFLGVRVADDGPTTRAFTLYLVTAAHVVRTELQTWVRLTGMEGALEDVPIPAWEFHWRDDVAIAVLDLDRRDPPYRMAVMPIPDFVSVGYQPMLGDNVYFAGLFSPIRAMGETNVPLVRSGTLAAWAQHGVPLRMPTPAPRGRPSQPAVPARLARGYGVRWAAQRNGPFRSGRSRAAHEPPHSPSSVATSSQGGGSASGVSARRPMYVSCRLVPSCM